MNLMQNMVTGEGHPYPILRSVLSSMSPPRRLLKMENSPVLFKASTLCILAASTSTAKTSGPPIQRETILPRELTDVLTSRRQLLTQPDKPLVEGLELVDDALLRRGVGVAADEAAGLLGHEVHSLGTVFRDAATLEDAFHKLVSPLSIESLVSDNRGRLRLAPLGDVGAPVRLDVVGVGPGCR